MISGIVLKYVFDYEYIPNKVYIEDVENRAFDWIVVGAGTSGSVLAYELSKNTNDSVLLIEAGGIFNFLSVVPSKKLFQKIRWILNFDFGNSSFLYDDARNSHGLGL